MGQASLSRTYFAAVGIVLLVLALGGCGRRGPLELPPGSPPQAGQATSTLADNQAAAFNEGTPPGVVQPTTQVVQTTTTSAQLAAQPPARPINAPPAPRTGRFILDPLL